MELSAENYVESLPEEPVYRYTFDKAQDGHLVLDGVRCVGVLNNSCTDIVDQRKNRWKMIPFHWKLQKRLP